MCEKHCKCHCDEEQRDDVSPWVFNDQESEEMEEITLDISDKDFLLIAKKAHEESITFNDMVSKILKEHIDGFDELAFTSNVQYDIEAKDFFINIPNAALFNIDLRDGDEVLWYNNGDGSWTLTKA